MYFALTVTYKHMTPARFAGMHILERNIWLKRELLGKY